MERNGRNGKGKEGMRRATKMGKGKKDKANTKENENDGKNSIICPYEVKLEQKMREKTTQKKG